MATRVVEGKKPYTGGKAISIDENKVISLNLRDENNLIIYDEGDDEIYVDLQLDDEITPTSAFPIGVNVGRVIVDNGWDKSGTIISAETTSGDNIKIFYADEGTLWIDNGTGTFKQIYFKSDVDALLLALRNYIDGELAKKQNGVSSDTAPSNPSEGDLWYDTTSSAMKVWDGTAWQSVGTGGGGSDIEYVTQAEYNALLPGALTDNKHYFIYTEDSPTPPTPWQPGANTMLYLPMDTDLLDHSGNSLTVNNLGSVSLVSTGTGASVPVAQFNSTSTELTFAYQGSINSAWTMSFWENTINQNTNAQFITAGTWSRHNLFQIGYTDSSSRGLTLSNYGEDINLGSYAGRDSSWHLITATYSGTAGQTNNAKVYMDGSLVMQGTMQGWNWNNNTFMIGNYNQETAMGGYLSKFIVETAERTAQEISDYFDQTKGDYGIS